MTINELRKPKFALLLLLCLICEVHPLFAADKGNSNQQKAVDALSSVVPAQVSSCIDKCADIQARFKEDREILERQADRQYSQLKDTFTWTVSALGLLITLAGGLFFFFFGKTRRELREMFDGILKKEVETLVTRDIEPVRERISQLQGGVDLLMSYRDRRVVWVADPNEKTDDTLEAFSSVGLTRIEVSTPADEQDINLGDSDLVVMSFDGSDRAKKLLKAVATKVKQLNGPVHLVVYTFGDGSKAIRLGDPEMAVLSELKWFSMTNFPSTMIAQVVSLVRGSVGSLKG
jgi:hypothetical protein